MSGTGPLHFRLRPSIHFRPHDAPVSEKLDLPYSMTATDDRLEITHAAESPSLRLRLRGQEVTFTVSHKRLRDILYRLEESRGCDYAGDLWSPGCFEFDLDPDRDAVLTASTETWETIDALKPEETLAAEHEPYTPRGCAPPGLERGRGAALLGEDGLVISHWSLVIRH